MIGLTKTDRYFPGVCTPRLAFLIQSFGPGVARRGLGRPLVLLCKPSILLHLTGWRCCHCKYTTVTGCRYAVLGTRNRAFCNFGAHLKSRRERSALPFDGPRILLWIVRRGKRGWCDEGAMRGPQRVRVLVPPHVLPCSFFSCPRRKSNHIPTSLHFWTCQLQIPGSVLKKRGEFR